MIKARTPMLKSQPKFWITLFLCTALLLDGNLFAQSACTTCGKTVKAELRLEGKGTLTIGDFTKTKTSDAAEIFELDFKIPPSGELVWNAAAEGSRGSGGAIVGKLKFFSCLPGVWAEGRWCSDPNIGSCCNDTNNCPDPCSGGECPVNPKDGMGEGNSQLFRNEDESFNPGKPSNPSAENSSDNSSPVPNQVSGTVSLGRTTHDYRVAGKPAGTVSFNFDAWPQPGGEIGVPNKDQVNPRASEFIRFFSDIPENIAVSIQDNNQLPPELGLRQIISEEAVVSIQQLATGVEIRTYSIEGAVVPEDSTGQVVTTASTLLSTVTVVTNSRTFHPSPTVWKGLKVTTAVPDQPSEVYELYSHLDGAANGEWIEVSGSSATKKVALDWVTAVVNGKSITSRMETVTDYAYDSEEENFYAVATHTNIYRKLNRASAGNWVERLVESTRGVGTDARTTYWFYEENSALPSHGKVIAQFNADGSWSRYAYDTDSANADNLLKASYSGWLDAGSAALASANTPAAILAAILAIPATECRSELVSYLTVPERTITRSYIKGMHISTTTDTEFTVIDPHSGTRVREKRSLVQGPDGSPLSDNRTGIAAIGSDTIGSLETTVYSLQSDGARVTYAKEESGQGDEFRLTQYTTYGTLAQPLGVPGRTLREVTVSDHERQLSSQTQVFLGGENYATIKTTTYQEAVENGILVKRVLEDGVEVSTTRYLTGDEVESTDEAGLRTLTVTDPTTGITTVTQVGGDAVQHNGQTLFSGEDIITFTSRHPRPGTTPLEGYLERSVMKAGAVTRILSETEYDVHGQIRRATDVHGITRLISYSKAANGSYTAQETLPGNLTRITSSYADGQLKSVTGSAVVGEFHQYDLQTGGKIRHTQFQGSESSPRWQRSFSDASGRQLRNERPGPGASNLIWTDRVYNSLGQLIRIQRSGGLAAEIYQYDSLGQAYRIGQDLNGNGVLDEVSAEPVTESVSSYEQSAGVWWRVQRSRVYEREETNGFRQLVQRTRLGMGPASVTESLTPAGAKTVTTVSVDRANRKRTTQTLQAGSSYQGEVVEIGGLTFFNTSPATLGYTEVASYSDFRELVKRARVGGIESYAYNSLTGRLESETLASNHTPPEGVTRTTTYTYIPVNQVNAGQIQSKDAPFSLMSAGTSTTYYSYDDLGRQTGQWGPGTYPVKYTFNAYGERQSMATYRTQTIASTTPPWGTTVAPDLVSTTVWEYDGSSGLLMAKTDPAQKVTSYAYKPGTTLLASRTWARQVLGQPLVSTYSYDGSGQLSGVSYSDGSTPAVSYTYRRDGSMATVLDAAGQHAFSDWSKDGRAQREVVSQHGSSLGLLAGLQRVHPADSLGRRAGYSGQWQGNAVQIELPSVSYSYHPTYGYWSQIQTGNLQMSWTKSTSGHIYSSSVTRKLIQGQGDYPALTSSISRSDPRGAFNVSHLHPEFRQGRVRNDNNLTAEIFKMDVHDTIFSTDPHFEILGLPVLLDTKSSIYTTDTRGQILSRSTPSEGGMTVSYNYDDIGNRVESGQGTPVGTDLSSLEKTAYSANVLNEYTSITRPDAVYVSGMAPWNQSVTINGQGASRLGSKYYRRLESNRSDDSQPAWMQVDVSSATSSPALTAERGGHLYMPPIPELPTYDADGNLAADGRWDYGWDAENRLVQMSTRAAAVLAGVPALRLTFAYDYRSRRIQKKVESYDTLDGWKLRSDVRFIYDGWNLISEVQMKGDAEDAPNAGIVQGGSVVRLAYLQRSYVWGPDVTGTGDGAAGVGGLLALTRHERKGRAVADHYWATWDLNGNVIGLAHTLKAGQMALYEYDPFGKTIRVNEPEPGLNPIRFSSKYTDVETGLLYYGYRYYSPEVGRWINRDPIEEKGGINLYGMVGNDAVNEVDMLGLWRIKRDPRKRRADAFADRGDTIRSLAKTVYLNEKEASHWAVGWNDSFDGSVDDTGLLGCSISVPNVMVTGFGDRKNANWLQEILGMSERDTQSQKNIFTNRLRGMGYMIEDIGEADRSTFLSSINNEDVTGFWIGGHGGGGGIKLSTDQNLYYMDFSRPVKFSLIYLNVCSAAAEPWENNLSKYGTFYGSNRTCGHITGDGKAQMRNAPRTTHAEVSYGDIFKPFTPEPIPVAHGD